MENPIHKKYPWLKTIAKPHKGVPSGWRTVKPDEVIQDIDQLLNRERQWLTVPPAFVGQVATEAIKLLQRIDVIYHGSKWGYIVIRPDVPPAYKPIRPGESLNKAEWVWQDNLWVQVEKSGTYPCNSLEVYIRRKPLSQLTQEGLSREWVNANNKEGNPDDIREWDFYQRSWPKEEP